MPPQPKPVPKPAAKPVDKPPPKPAPPPPLKVVVFGASGRVGRLVVDAVLKRGSLVTAFTRNSNNIRVKHANLRISGGNVSDDIAVREAMKGQDLAVVALGAKDISRPHSVCSDGIRRIVAAARNLGVKRIVALGNVGLLPHPSGKMVGEVSLAPFLEFMFVDQRNAYLELKESSVDWVMLCPPFMPLGQATGKYRTSVEAPLERATSISVEDVAHAMVNEIYDAPHHHARVGLAY